MEKVKRYELSRKNYISVLDEKKTSYGGSQQWFAKELKRTKQSMTHTHGCGVIATSDLFLYWAMTLPYNKGYSVNVLLEKEGHLLKENYMTFIEYVRDTYVPILPIVGVPNIELIAAINSYTLFHHIPYKARLGYLLDEKKLLMQIIEMIKNDLPVILLIGVPFPNMLYHTLLKDKKVGVTFYEKWQKDKETYREVMHHIKGHYVTITGVIINKEAESKREKVMLRISSWGKEYYISYYEYCKYEIKYGVDIQGSIVRILPR